MIPLTPVGPTQPPPGASAATTTATPEETAEFRRLLGETPEDAKDAATLPETDVPTPDPEASDPARVDADAEEMLRAELTEGVDPLLRDSPALVPRVSDGSRPAEAELGALPRRGVGHGVLEAANAPNSAGEVGRQISGEATGTLTSPIGGRQPSNANGPQIVTGMDGGAVDADGAPLRNGEQASLLGRANSQALATEAPARAAENGLAALAMPHPKLAARSPLTGPDSAGKTLPAALDRVGGRPDLSETGGFADRATEVGPVPDQRFAVRSDTAQQDAPPRHWAQGTPTPMAAVAAPGQGTPPDATSFDAGALDGVEISSLSPQSDVARSEAARPIPLADLPNAILAKIREMIAATPAPPPGRTEITLSPAELGRVTFIIGQEDGLLSLQVFAERPETLDTIRRHADILQRAAADGPIRFTLEQEGAGRQQPEPQAETRAKDSAEGEFVDPTPAQQASAPKPSGARLLDLRL